MRKVLGYGCGLIVLIYFCGVILFWHRFPAGITLDGMPIGFLTKKEAFVQRVQETKRQRLVLLRRGDSAEYVSYDDLGISRLSDKQVLDLKLQPWLWFLQLGKSYVFSDELDYDADQLRAGISRLNCVSSKYVVPPQTAGVALESDGSFRVTPESRGSLINQDRLFTVLCDAISTKTSVIDLDVLGCYEELDTSLIQPDIPVSEKPEQITCTLDMGAGVTEAVPEALLSVLFREESGVWYLQYSMLQSYVAGLSKKYDTVGFLREFETSVGTTVGLTPQVSDTYVGWELDKKQTVMQLVKALLSGKSQTVRAVWLGKGMVHNKTWDVGRTYVEISIEQQHLWYYENGVLRLDTDVTTGLNVDSRKTPTGLFRTLDFYRNYTMHGGYGSAYCDYFIRLTPNGVGIHDASWRSEFGGQAYQNDGSHGCINTPYDAVKSLYEMLEQQLPQSVPVIIW